MISHKITKVKPPPIIQTGVFNFAVYGQADLDAYLLRNPFQEGDWLYFPTSSMSTDAIMSSSVSVVVKVQREFTKEVVRAGRMLPFLLMGLNGTSQYCRAPDYKFSREPHVRWDDGLGMSVIPDAVKQRLNDDYVQNYIKTYLDKAKSHSR